MNKKIRGDRNEYKNMTSLKFGKSSDEETNPKPPSKD
jgi:hypothetical protein